MKAFIFIERINWINWIPAYFYYLLKQVMDDDNAIINRKTNLKLENLKIVRLLNTAYGDVFTNSIVKVIV